MAKGEWDGAGTSFAASDIDNADDKSDGVWRSLLSTVPCGPRRRPGCKTLRSPEEEDGTRATSSTQLEPIAENAAESDQAKDSRREAEVRGLNGRAVITSTGTTGWDSEVGTTLSFPHVLPPRCSLLPTNPDDRGTDEGSQFPSSTVVTFFKATLTSLLLESVLRTSATIGVAH